MMSKSILIVKGSPRINGNSAALADQVFAGAKQAGAVVEAINLAGLDIRPCDACDVCSESYGGCIVEDDMQSLYPKLTQADVIVLAFPIYFFTINAQMKLFIDRWYALEREEGNLLRDKQLALAFVYGDTDLYTSGGINAINTFEASSRYIGIEIAGMVYGSADKVGEVEKQPELMAQAFNLGAKIAA
ncbi:MAG: flavodoxin family protein [Anaerolineales bacterium]|nr:flavodoxin family protein [Anaerolineales bacterium]